MPGSITGTADFAALSARLKEAGETGLRRELYKAIDKSAQDLAKEIRSAEHLYPYMPNHYADTLAADMSVRVYKRSGRDPHLTIRAEGRAHKRKLVQLDERGILVHPVFGRGGGGPGNPFRRDWVWREQFRSVRQGFFTDPVEHAVPQIRDRIRAAMRETARKITAGG
jgi:hypothetical protein